MSQNTGKEVFINGFHHTGTEGLFLDQSGSYMEFRGLCKELKAEIYGASGEYPAFLAVAVKEEGDSTVKWRRSFEIQNGIHEYDLYHAETEGRRTVRILKITEEQYGNVAVRKLMADGSERFFSAGEPIQDVQNGAWVESNPNSARDRKRNRILFLGDSMTCGYGVDGTIRDVFTTASENFMKAYPYLLAQKLDADYDTLCSSGDGIISRYVDEGEEGPLTEDLMPALFDRALRQGNFDHKEYSMVICNLGTNDASYIRGIPERENKFAKAYRDFLQTVYESIHAARIVVVYGIMEKSLTECIEKLVSELRESGIPADFVKIENPGELNGVCFHPGEAAHKTVSEQIYEYVKEVSEESF